MTACIACAARAADEPPAFAEGRDDSALYAVDTVLTGLDNPASLAVRPGSAPTGPFEIYISESGAGRVVRLTTDKAEATPAITGFAVTPLPADPAIRVGPLGLDFLSRNLLVVGTGALGAGQDLVRVYNLGNKSAPLEYDQAEHSAGPVAKSARSSTGEGAFFSIAHTETAMFIAPHNGDERGWILRATLDANRVAGLEPFIAAKEAAGVARPTCATIDPRDHHHYLVVGEMGEPTAERDSRVTTYSPASGAVALNLATGLRDIKSLAYSTSGDLYAADFAEETAAEGGVYRLEAAEVDGRESCRAVKIASVVHPTSLAFAFDGTLYVTAIGDYEKSGGKPTGVLLKISPKGETPKL